MEFHINVEQVKRKVPVTIFHISGSLNIASADALEEQARQALGQGTRSLLLDFKNVDAIRSAGLRSVQVVYRMLTPKPADEIATEPTKSPFLKIVNLSPDVYYVFEVSGFLRNIASYDDLETALDSFN